MERLMCSEWIAELVAIDDALAQIRIRLRNLNRSGQEDSGKALYYHGRIRTLRMRKVVLEAKLKERAGQGG